MPFIRIGILINAFCICVLFVPTIFALLFVVCARVFFLSSLDGDVVVVVVDVAVVQFFLLFFPADADRFFFISASRFDRSRMMADVLSARAFTHSRVLP